MESFNVFIRYLQILRKDGKFKKKIVKGLTLKSLSSTRWKSRVDNVKVIKFQIIEIREALLQLENINSA